MTNLFNRTSHFSNIFHFYTNPRFHPTTQISITMSRRELMSSARKDLKMSFRQSFNTELQNLLQEIVTVSLSRWFSIEAMFDFADKNSSGDLDKEQLRDFLEELRILDHISDFDRLWDTLDLDGNGAISKDEWIFTLEDVEPVMTDTLKCQNTWAPGFEPKYDTEVDGGLIGLVAHNKMKPTMTHFVESNINFFKNLHIVTTGSTGKSLENKLGLKVEHKVASGPLGGDQEIGALVTQGKVAGIFFFKDPLTAHQHAADIEALTRICDVHNVPYATNSSSGKALILAMYSMGIGFGQRRGDSDTVKAYKAEQAAVIQKVSQVSVSKN